MPESQVQSSIISLLKRYHVDFNRSNGAQFTVAGVNKRGVSSKRIVRCNSIKGKADIEIWAHATNGDAIIPIALYLEVKRSDGGRQSGDQKGFQDMVERHGGFYSIVRSIDDTLAFFNKVSNVIQERLPGFSLVVGRIKNFKRG